MKPALIDDQLLSDVLRHGTGDPLRRRQVFTTGYWYVRLCHAVLAGRGGHSALSGPFTSLPEHLRTRAMAAVMELPDSIGLVSLRHLAPLIGNLRRDHSLNILGMEALAAAMHLQADVFLSADSPRLQEALATEGIDVRVGPSSGTAGARPS